MTNDYIDLPILPLQSIDNVPRTARALWTWGTCLTEATRDRLLAAYPEAVCYDIPDGNHHGTPARYLIVNPRIVNALG